MNNMRFLCRLTCYRATISIADSPFHRDCSDPAAEKENISCISKMRKLYHNKLIIFESMHLKFESTKSIIKLFHELLIVIREKEII